VVRVGVSIVWEEGPVKLKHNWIAGFYRYLAMRRGKIAAELAKQKSICDSMAKWR
jgi:hypothetical protein